MAALLPMSRSPFKDCLRQPGNFWCDRMCPRIAEAKFGSSFFSGDFRRGFNGGAERVAHYTGKFSVSVVDAPQFILILRDQIHGSSEHQTVRCIVPVRHILLRGLP